MRRLALTLSLLALTLGGCASQTSGVASAQHPITYAPENATALAFDPPVLAGMPRLDLSRDGRGPSAFQGFDEGQTTYYSLRTDDFYSDFVGGWGGGRGGRGQSPDNYQREAVGETYGISYH